MKKYCMSCGSPTEYSLKAPNFCSNCGKSFTGIKEQTLKTKEIQADLEDRYDDDDDNIKEVNYVPQISKLDIEADFLETKNKGTKIEDLIKNSNHSKIKKEKNKKNKKSISRKKILEDFAAEAGSIRQKNK